jgi:hypothetical protein
MIENGHDKWLVLWVEMNIVWNSLRRTIFSHPVDYTEIEEDIRNYGKGLS